MSTHDNVANIIIPVPTLKYNSLDLSPTPKLTTKTTGAGSLEAKDETKCSDIEFVHQLKSILGKCHRQSGRKDRFGTLIGGTKKQRVVFRDSIAGHKVSDIKEVESYKDYNVLKEADKASCSCALL